MENFSTNLQTLHQESNYIQICETLRHLMKRDSEDSCNDTGGNFGFNTYNFLTFIVLVVNFKILRYVIEFFTKGFNLHSIILILC